MVRIAAIARFAGSDIHRRSVSSSFSLLIALLALGMCGQTAQASLLGAWKADNYVAGGNWTDSAAATPIVATQHGSPTVVANAFGAHKGIDLSGGKYFTVLAARNPLAGKTSFTLAAVFRPTAAGNTGSAWYQASGLIGMEQGGVVNDFGFGWSGDGGGRVKAGLGIPQAGADPVVTSPTVALNTTHAAVFTYNGATGVLTLFVDGQQVATTSSTPGTGRNAGDFALGAMTSGGGNPFPGLIAELQMYDSAENGATLSSSLLSTYASANLITSFTANKTTAYEGDAVQLSWAVSTAGTSGTFSVSIKRGTTTVYSGSAASGNTTTNIPALSGTAQPITYTLTVTEVGGNGITDTEQVVINCDPGIPSGTSQYWLPVVETTSKPITLTGSDPNGGTLTYTIITPPAHGTLSGTAPNVTYTAAAGYTGDDSFTFRVNDGVYESQPATVSLLVTGPSVAPSAVTLSNSLISTATGSGAFIANISSTDSNRGEAHTYTLVSGDGSTDNARFSIVGNQLRAAQSFAGMAGSTVQIRIRSTDGGGLATEQSFSLTVQAPTGGIVINEIHYNGVDNTVRNNFIELYNGGTSTVSLDGWRLSGGIDYAFPPGTTIAAGAYLLIAEDPATIQTKWGKTALGPWVGGLNSDGETVRLRNLSDVIVCEVDYKPSFPWPVAADGQGASMELINPSLDPGLGSSWRSSVIPAANATTDIASPGARNLQYADNAAPNIRQVNATPSQPAANAPIVITAKVTDPNGVANVTLQYQIVAPGSFIPATLPNPIVNNDVATTPLQANPAFENAANWTSLPMKDDGVGADLKDGDGIYSATIPGQPNRTLVRYRIVVADNLGSTIRVPYADDGSLNFACFVYNGVPAYQGSSPAILQTLPVYHFLTRKSDYDDCVAYDTTKQLNGQAGRTWENWEAALVYDGVVYDHIKYRLHGGNGRYYFTSKRAFRFFFNTGYDFQGKDNDGNPYPTTWKSIITENCWENRGTLTYSLNEAVNFYLWNQIGIPAPLGNWGHFRTITTTAEQPDPWHGDFWGLIYIHEEYDGRFLDSHKLPKGNLYKLTRDPIAGLAQQRYQAPFAVKNGSDHDVIYNNLKGTSTPAFINAHVNLDRWCYYHALAEAVRHYDYWPSGDNNGAYYFEPTYTAANGNRGRLWILPNDVDATWGPTWNNGHDIVHNALFNDSISPGGDASTNPTLWPQYFNAVREVRDLLWQPDQINPVLDQFAAVITPFVPADSARWKTAPSDAGNFTGLGGAGSVSLASLVQDMKRFAFNGGSWPGDSGTIPARSTHLDNLQNGIGNSEGSQIPATPTITYLGAAAHPVNDLRFSTSVFSDPQGISTFGAIQWRMAEVTDSTAPAYVPGEKVKLEWNASYDSGEIITFAEQFSFPAVACRPGHAYRARVRHKDTSGRWSHWSAPVQFIAGAADVSVFKSSLVISEFMYHPLAPTSQEQALGYVEDDFEYIELRNVSATPVDLTNVRFTKGIDFDFPAGYTLAPGASTLVVRNLAAFNSRYGTGKPIAGVWQTGNSLSNSGEQIKLSYGAGEAIIDFTYDDASPWPVEADTLGYSLVLVSPESRPDPTLAASWRASRMAGGSPGTDDRMTFASWSAAYPGASDPNGDADFDGIKNLVEYALGGNPAVSEAGVLPATSVQSLDVNGVTSDYLTITFHRRAGVEDVACHVEFSSDLTTWSESGVLVNSSPNSDGSVSETWRAASPVSAGAKLFGRVRVTAP